MRTRRHITHAKRVQRIRQSQVCNDCKINIGDTGEYAYMVRPLLWPTGVRFLCIGCLENRLDRQLTTKDFTSSPINYMDGFSRSTRLRNRQGLS